MFIHFFIRIMNSPMFATKGPKQLVNIDSINGIAHSIAKTTV